MTVGAGTGAVAAVAAAVTAVTPACAMTACTQALSRASAPALPHVWRVLRRAVAVGSDRPGGGKGQVWGRRSRRRWSWGVGGGWAGVGCGRVLVVRGSARRCGTSFFFYCGGLGMPIFFLSGGALARPLLPPRSPPRWMVIGATHWPTPPKTRCVRPGLSTIARAVVGGGGLVGTAVCGERGAEGGGWPAAFSDPPSQ